MNVVVVLILSGLGIRQSVGYFSFLLLSSSPLPNKKRQGAAQVFICGTNPGSHGPEFCFISGPGAVQGVSL